MQDPHLPPKLFLHDRVLVRELLFPGKGPVRVLGAHYDGESLVVRTEGPATIALVLPERDLSRFTEFSLTVINRTSELNLVGMRLVHGSHTSNTELPDTSFSGGREPLSPHERREIRLPRAAFGTYGHPAGWTDLEKIEITLAHEKDHIGSREIDAVIESIAGDTREVPRGPRLTSDGLVEMLSESVLKTVAIEGRKAVEEASRFSKDDRQDACPTKAKSQTLGRLPVPVGRVSGGTSRFAVRQISPGDPLATVWSNRWAPFGPESLGLIPPPHSYPQESAEEILSGRIMGQQLGHPVPWDANPLGELEWCHFLHRHHFMRPLVREAAAEQDERCSEALDRMIAHWIASNPVPVGSNGGAGPPWETLTAAWRLREWLWVVGMVWHLPGFTQETRELMLRSIWEHAQHLMDHQGHPNNWLIVESAALALAGLCFPEVRDAAEWAGTGLERLQTEVARQFFPDGAHFEISPMYHAICVHACVEVVQVCRAVEHSLPNGFEATIELAAEYLAALCRPDFTWPSLNDSGGAAGDYTALLRLAGEIFSRDDFTWIGTRGDHGRPPTVTFRTFPDAGIAVMRSGWERDAHQLVFRGGPPGFSHVHGDVLSLDVTTHGAARLVDPGISTYAPGPLTDHYRSAESHTTILLDDKDSGRLCVPFPERIRSVREKLIWRSDVHGDEVTAFLDYPSGNSEGDRTDSTESSHSGSREDKSPLPPFRKGGDEAVPPFEKGGLGGISSFKSHATTAESGTDSGNDIRIARTVRFLGRRYWIITDRIDGTGTHSITTSWQFAPGNLEVETESGAIRKVDEDGTSFTILPLRGEHALKMRVGTGERDPPMGWVSLNGADIPAPMCRYMVEADLPVTLVWLLVPERAAGGEWVRAERRDGADGDVEVEVHLPGGVVLP